MTSYPAYLQKTPEGCRLHIRALPRSAHSRIEGIRGDALAVRLHAAPEGGKANEELVSLLRKIFRVPRQDIKILHGDKSRSKWVEIRGLKPSEAAAAVLSHHKS